MFGILPFGAGDHLFKTIQVLEARQQRLLGQARGARKQADAIGCMGQRISSGRIALQDTAHGDARVDAIAAQAVATGEDQFEYAIAHGSGVSQHFAADQGLIRTQGEAPAPLFKALQVTVEQHRLPGLDGDGLKQAIAVRQATIFQGHAARWLTVDPAVHHSANRRNTREPLVPPKPNELEITTSIGIGCAS
ncbi:hypothetical protein [Pseudomonas sp. 22 E 5]|nr:hypothetical protein [Pseudomonas sp. 22 E 5]